MQTRAPGRSRTHTAHETRQPRLLPSRACVRAGLAVGGGTVIARQQPPLSLLPSNRQDTARKASS